jgi:hypothetical protein
VGPPDAFGVEGAPFYPMPSFPWSSGPGPRLCVSGRGFDSYPGDQYVRTGNSQSLSDRVVG